MRALMVEDEAEAIELFLLRRHRASRRLGRILLQCAMHSFVSSVLLRVPWLNAFLDDAELRIRLSNALCSRSAFSDALKL